MKIKYIINFFFTIILFDDLVYLYTGISISGKLSSLFLTILIFSFFLLRNRVPKIVKESIFSFFLFIMLNLIIQLLFFSANFNLFSFIYEAYKLGIYFSLLIFLFLSQKDSLSIVKFSLKLFSIFIILNFIILFSQHLFGVSIIRYIGLSSSLLDFQFIRNRPSGITTGANIIGVSSLFIFIILNYYLIEKEKFEFKSKQIKWIKLMIYIAILTIILSTSKNALLLLFLYPFFMGKIKKHYYMFIILVVLFGIYIIYSNNIYGLHDKISMYQYVLHNYNNFDSGLLEHRALSILEGSNIFIGNFPFGSGLGTWGDYSSSLNTSIENPNIMSDSYFIHILVEQGFLVILYFILLLRLVKKNIIGIYFLVSLWIVFLPTMGFGSSTFPYLFSFFLFLINFKKADSHTKRIP